MTRYQSILDVLVDAGRFETIYFDHETELPVPYREICFLRRNALQEQRGKDRILHKKWADICAIGNQTVKVIIEEERKATEGKVKADIEIIAKCRYLWTDDTLFAFDPDCVLFILLNDNVNGIQEHIISNAGNLKRVVICNKESFATKYAQYGKLHAH